MTIENKFENVVIKYRKIRLYRADDAIKVVKECTKLNKTNFGIDAFKLYDANTRSQPFMEYSINFSDNLLSGCWSESIEFIKKQTDKESVFEIVYDRN